MKINIEVDEATIIKLISDHVQRQLGEATVGRVTLLVKTKQNFRAVWEVGAIIATTTPEKHVKDLEFKADVEAT